MGSKRREQRKDMEYERGKLMNENLEVEDNFLSFFLIIGGIGSNMLQSTEKWAIFLFFIFKIIFLHLMPDVLLVGFSTTL